MHRLLECDFLYQFYLTFLLLISLQILIQEQSLDWDMQ